MSFERNSGMESKGVENCVGFLEGQPLSCDGGVSDDNGMTMKRAFLKLMARLGWERHNNPWRPYPENVPTEKRAYLTFVQNTEPVVTAWEGADWSFKMPVSHWRELPPRP